MSLKLVSKLRNKQLPLLYLKTTTAVLEEVKNLVWEVILMEQMSSVKENGFAVRVFTLMDKWLQQFLTLILSLLITWAIMLMWPSTANNSLVNLSLLGITISKSKRLNQTLDLSKEALTLSSVDAAFMTPQSSVFNSKLMVKKEFVKLLLTGIVKTVPFAAQFLLFPGCSTLQKVQSNQFTTRVNLH